MLSQATESTASMKEDHAINDPLDTKMLCDQLNQGLGDPSTLVANFKATKEARDAAKTGMFNDFVSLSETSNHLDKLSLLAMQESTHNPLYNDYIDTCIKHVDEVYSFGVSDNFIVPSLDSTLKLHATSFGLVCTKHANTCVDCMLRVLFDSGSEHKSFTR
jgi:hypothetical protein